MMPSDIEDSYPLSPMQRAMLSHSLSASGSGAYIQHAICDLREHVDAALLERAWRSVVERHAALRTAFRLEGTGDPMQAVHRRVAVPWTHEDWTGLAPGESGHRFDLHIGIDRQRDFDLQCAPLMRLALFRLAKTHFRFLWTYHHALLDGRSVRIVLREVFDLYDAYAAGRDLQLPPPPAYRDHIDWLARQDAAAAGRYWQQALAGHRVPTTLEGQLPQPGGEGPAQRYGAHEIRLSAQSTEALRSVAHERRLTLNTLVLGAWAQLLGRYTGDSEVSFGTTLTLRGAGPEAFRETVGLLINTVPLRVPLPPGMPLSRWLEALRAQWLAMRAHSWAPLTKIRHWGGVTRDNALFSTLVVFENAPLDAALEEDRKLWTTRQFDRKSAAAYPLTLVAFGGTELSLKIVYQQSLFPSASIASMLEHLRIVLEAAPGDLERPLRDQALLTEAERKRLLIEWNDTGRTFPFEGGTHRLFERQVERTPEAVAIESAARTLTYRELDHRSNQLARALRRSGVGTDTLVGLCMERSPDLIVAMLGIWQLVLDVGEIGVLDHFFEIGGHSLLAARLLDEIERETGLTAPLAALFVDDTIAGVARALRASPAALTAPIIAINSDGASPPLVFLHGDLTGGGFYCHSLAKALGSGQPMLVVQPHGLDNAPIPDTIEAMAADRIRALHAIRPHGPYVLGGYCNGAFVAFEMARQLIEGGDEVPRIIVIEAVAPSGGAADAATAGQRYLNFDRGGGVRVAAARDRASEAQLRYSQAMDRYAGGRYAGRLVLVRSSAVGDTRRDLGWARFAASVELHVLPGDHVTLVTRHVGALARVLRGAVDRMLAGAT